VGNYRANGRNSAKTGATGFHGLGLRRDDSKGILTTQSFGRVRSRPFGFATGPKRGQVPPVSRPLRRLPLVEQTAAHLREGFQSGRWVGQLPGVLQLAEELVVSKHIVRSALKVLEEEGWLEDCGAGRRRKIVPDQVKKATRRPLRIGMLLYVPLEEDDAQTVTILLGVRHAIETSGHTCIFSDRFLAQMGDNLSKISRAVKATEADAWIVCLASRVVMEWFAAQPFPVFAFGGRFQNLPVACCGTNAGPAIESAVNALAAHGHRRIALLIQPRYVHPTPVITVKTFLTTLEACGITPTAYNLPHLEDSADGVEECMNSLFHLTPPTALLVHEACHGAAVLSFLARRGLRVPQDVSLICMVLDPVFRLCTPTIDHFQLPLKQHVVRMSRWVGEIARGRPDRLQAIADAVYVPGGTVGPAKK
jgi:DNA-binding LacI/PurR family transcriptional regulator